jgi:hypothetical protein
MHRTAPTQADGRVAVFLFSGSNAALAPPLSLFFPCRTAEGGGGNEKEGANENHETQPVSPLLPLGFFLLVDLDYYYTQSPRHVYTQTGRQTKKKKTALKGRKPLDMENINKNRKKGDERPLVGEGEA